MTESRIRALIFSFGATSIWLYLVYLVTMNPELSWWQIVIMIVVGIFLTAAAMGQGE